MTRWGKTNLEDIAEGDRVRITVHRYAKGEDTLITTEGRVLEIERRTTTGRKGPLTGSALPDITEVVGLLLPGWRVDLVDALAGRNGWILDLVEKGLPALPITPGSVIETQETHLAAVLRRVHGVDVDSHKVWEWADGSPGGPRDEQLQSARIIYVARG